LEPARLGKPGWKRTVIPTAAADERAPWHTARPGIEQVNQAISQMDQVTQQNAALVEEAAAPAQSLRAWPDDAATKKC
jgi:hypothetical protein